ncbi:MAG: UDP-N-acetylmuramate--L-alanine ligase [Acidimicrobiales bacterium]
MAEPVQGATDVELGPEDLEALRRIHVVGAGGAAMSGLATILATMGHGVTGSDRSDSPVVARLRRQGIPVAVGHDHPDLAGVDLVAASSAVPRSDAELREADRLGIPVVRRAQVLAALCALRRSVAIAGTKGKTTTTAMVVRILEEAGSRPSFLVGGDVPGVDGGARWVADSPWLVVEADESDGTFLRLAVEAAVVTNVEEDHLDFYGSMDALRRAFETFARQAARVRVVGVDTPESAALAGRLDDATTYGTSPDATVRVGDVRTDRDRSAFDLALGDGSPPLQLALPVPGVHNARNAAGAIAVTTRLGFAAGTAAAALATYRPVGRRFEWRGEHEGVAFIDDYAHVPSAVAAALATARAGGWGRIVAVFQPHLYSRTVALGPGIGAALAAADVVVVTDVYASREQPVAGVDGRIVADAARRARPGLEVHYVAERGRLAAAVQPLLRPGDLCLSIGAGDITGLADELVAGRGS